MSYLRAILMLVILTLVPASAYSAVWETLETENFIIHYAPGRENPARRLAEAAEGLREQTVAAVGFDFKHRTRVYLAPDQETYQAVQPRSVIPEWSVGVAFPNENLIALYTPGAGRKVGFGYDMITVFHHELCHVVLHRALRDVRIPRWLDEGFAKLHAHEWTRSDSFRMTVAYFLGGLIPLEELMASWPKDERRARIAYLQSKVFVAYLERLGYLPEIIRLMMQGKPAESAVTLATGYPIPVLENRWLDYLKRSHSWVFFMFRGEVVWTSMALLFLFAYWRVRLRAKRKLRRMALEDELEGHIDDHRTYH